MFLRWLSRRRWVHVEVNQGWVEDIVGEGEWRVGQEFLQVVFLEEMAQVLEEAHVLGVDRMFRCGPK